MTLSSRRSPRSFFASSERSSCSRSRYSGVTSPVTYSPEKQEVSNSSMRASSCLQAAIRSVEILVDQPVGADEPRDLIDRVRPLATSSRAAGMSMP